MLRLDRVGRRFGKLEVLADICLTIETGAFIVLLGPSGCGKSTLLRLIAGLDQPDTGAIAWTAGAPPRPGRIGTVFQEPVLLPWASARANVALPLRLGGMARRDAEAAADAALGRIGLRGFETTRPRALSGGMRMRTSLARALITRPALLLLDEPFAALDEPTRHRLQDDLLALRREFGCTIVFVTHSVYEAVFLADRIAVLSQRPGRLTATIEIAAHAGRADPAYAAQVAAISAGLHG